MASSRDTPFIELLCKTNFSFLEGASFPQEMFENAQALGYPALGIVDTNGVYGIPRSQLAAQTFGVRLVTGAEIRLQDISIFALAKNRNGYGNLCEILSALHRHEIPPTLKQFPVLFEKSADLYFFCKGFSRDFSRVFSGAEVLRICELPNLYLIATLFFDAFHERSLAQTLALSQKLDRPVIASNLPLFHSRSRKPLHDVLTSIKHHTPLSKAGFHLLPNSERCLKSPDEMRALFRQHPLHPQWLENTLRIAGDCTFALSDLRYQYPNEWLPPGETGDGYLKRLVLEGAERRYGVTLPLAVQNQIHHELRLVADLQYADYFLTIWDIVQFATSQKILFQGRGSAANSIICFLLGITAIDPVRMDLLFERFLSRERKEPPDIDIDFEHERREEVIQYIYRRYGRHRAAITAEVICFRRRSSIREVGKAFDLSTQTIDRALAHTSGSRHGTAMASGPGRTPITNGTAPSLDWEGFYNASPEYSRRLLEHFTEITRLIRGFPRHIGTHVGGFVLCQDSLMRNVPIENAAMPDRTIIQWDKNDLDDLGFVRVDILGLGILTCLRKALALLSERSQTQWTLASLPAEDPRVYDALCRGDTVGVFQIESRAQMNMLPRLKPRNFFDLVVEIAIVRPGPIQGEMVHPYLRRRSGEEPVTYAHPKLQNILHKTYGVPLFQEQIMKMAMEVAGFSPGEADALRRAMGTWRKDGSLSHLGNRFREGLKAQGISSQFAEQIFHQIEGFAEYGFPESHAASFAILAYATAYLKIYHPDIYLTALLNSQPMGFYQSHSLIHDAQRHGVKCLPIDINHSTWDNRLEKSATEEPRGVRLGFREIKGISRKWVDSLIPQQPFASLDDLVSRLRSKGIGKRDLLLLAGADALGSIGLTRRQALWEIQSLPIPDSIYMVSDTADGVALPDENSWERILLDYDSSGVSLFAHPIQVLRTDLEKQKVVSAAGLKFLRDKAPVRVAGLVICRQRPPSASGVLFITLEDEFGFINLVIWNDVYQRYKECLNSQSFLLCDGTIQRAPKTQVIHVIVRCPSTFQLKR